MMDDTFIQTSKHLEEASLGGLLRIDITALLRCPRTSWSQALFGIPQDASSLDGNLW